MTSSRGAVLVESAFALSLILIFIYGAVQLGMVGLEQLTVDGGAYTAAHQKALLGKNLKGYEEAPKLAKATLSHLNSPNISVPDPTFGQPPTTDFVGQYGVTNSSARHGGVSMIQPVQTVSYITSSNFASLLFGVVNSISVTGIAIDPAFRLINGHGDISGKDFNTPEAFQTASDPLVDGNNAPPYFIGFNYVRQCPQTDPQNVGPWNSCPKPVMAALGIAEYLDIDNWGRLVNGVVPDRQAVFYEARLHQDKFASIANALSQPGADKVAILDPLSVTQGKDVHCVYSFDNTRLGSYSIGTKKIGDYPVTPAGDPVVCAP